MEEVTSLRHPLTRSLLALTFTAGVIDAVSFLGLGQVFTANMTGNVVLLGFGIAGGAGLPVVAPIVSLCAFMAGAVAGGVLAKRLAERRRSHVAWALTIETVMLAAAAVFAAAVEIDVSGGSGYVLIGLIAGAMGVRNTTSIRLAVPDMTTTVVTLTLARLAADSPFAGGSGEGTTRRTAGVVAIFAGALAGALMLKTSLVLPIAVAAGLALLTCVAYLRSPSGLTSEPQG